MKEFIEQEKKRIQKGLRFFNSDGAVMTISMDKEYIEDEGMRIRAHLDSITILRVALHFDAKGNHTKTDFWMMWKPIGYPEEWRHCHLAKIIDWRVEEDFANGSWIEVRLKDDLNREYLIQAICASVESEKAEYWKKWQQYRKENASWLDELDARQLKEFTEMAENWEEE